MVKSSAVCSNCSMVRSGFDVLCPYCGSPFILNISGPYSKYTDENFPYINEFILKPSKGVDFESLDGINMKIEFKTPTLSYKDRGMNNLFSYLRGKKYFESGERVSEDSSGNAGASFSLFARICNLTPEVFVSNNSNPVKLNQIVRYGGHINKVNGSRKDVEIAARNSGFKYLGHQYWPEFYDGFRLISYEIYEYAEHMPDAIFIPFSTGTLYLGIYAGFKHLLDSGIIEKIPLLVGVQPKNACGMYNVVNNTEFPVKGSVADALTGVVPLRARILMEIIQKYGSIEIVDEENIIDGQSRLLDSGIDAEYSSAIAYSAAMMHGEMKNKMVILTGHGIKNLLSD